MIRKKIAELTDDDSGIRWRSHEPARIETFSDAVFAFSLTLVIVSLEVPKSFDQLYETMKGTVSFAICFMILFMIWNQQNLFFRRYGLRDPFTMFLNACLLFMVLIYAYPLKFLFFLIFSNHMYMANGQAHPMIYDSQQPTLMMIYGVGFSIIYFLFFLMYWHAGRNAKALGLNKRELYMTYTCLGDNFIMLLIGLIAIATAYILPPAIAGNSGMVYISIPLALTIWYSYRGRGERKLRHTNA